MEWWHFIANLVHVSACRLIIKIHFPNNGFKRRDVFLNLQHPCNVSNESTSIFVVQGIQANFHTTYVNTMEGPSLWQLEASLICQIRRVYECFTSKRLLISKQCTCLPTSMLLEQVMLVIYTLKSPKSLDCMYGVRYTRLNKKTKTDCFSNLLSTMAQTKNLKTYTKPKPLWQDTHEVSMNLTHTRMCQQDTSLFSNQTMHPIQEPNTWKV